MLIDIDKFLWKYFTQKEKILIACSAGVDSMTLLHHLFQSSWYENIVICHFNHQTRSECEEEEKYLTKLASKKWIKIEIASFNFEKIQKLYPLKSFEELARDKRYHFFDEMMQLHSAPKILLAHHLDDKCETAMFRLARGTKLWWLINMTESSSTLLRPFISIKKTDILSYARDQWIIYYEDSTNNDSNYTRNFIRHKVMPQFEKIHPNACVNFNNFLNYAEELQYFIAAEVEAFLLEQSQNTFVISSFSKQPNFLQREIIKKLYSMAHSWSTLWLTSSNIEEIIKYIHGPYGNTKKELGSLTLYKKNGIISY